MPGNVSFHSHSMDKDIGEKISRHKLSGIFLRTFTLLFLLTLIVVIIFSAAIIPGQQNAILKALESQARTVSSSLSQVAGNAIVNEDYEFIVEHCLEVLKNSPEILYIVVMRRGGFTLVHTPDQWIQEENPDSMWSFQKDGLLKGKVVQTQLARQKSFHLMYPLSYSGVEWGNLHIGLSMEHLNRETRAVYISIFLLSLFCLLFGSIIAFFFARRLTRPVLALHDVIHRVSAGDFSARARTEIATRDEIADLAASFNQMAERLEKTTVSRDYLTSIINTMTDALFVTSPDGTITKVNQACLNLLGYTEPDLLNRSLEMLFGNESEETNREKIADLADKGDFHHLEKSLYSKDKTKIPILFSGAALRDEKGCVTNIICMALDVRERLAAEKALKKSYQELKSAQSQLVQSGKLASIGELASGVAHELNQPLMVIRGNAQLIQRMLRKGNPGAVDLTEQLEPILRNTKRMMNIINHLRTFSRQSQSDFQSVDLQKVIDDSFLMVGEQLRIRDIEVISQVEAGFPQIKGDANQLEQVFLNLITNARDAIDARRASLEDRDEFKGRLEIIAKSTEELGFIEILVGDNGQGIPPEVQAKIFDPFFTTKEVGRGTGLGLSISYGIIQDHKGEIEVAEAGSEGTTFRITLPVS